MVVSEKNKCRAILIAAPSSGQGKTVFTAALARRMVNLGKSVRILKVGPDYLDPMILEVASGRPVWNLDWWMMGESGCLSVLREAAAQVDVILVEGVMGLFDNEPSNAWIAKHFNLEVALIMDMAKFAQTAAAVVHGMQRYDPELTLSAVIGNRLGSEHHRTLVAEAMPVSMPYAGSIRRDDRMTIPERYLGLVQAKEIKDLSNQLDDAAQCIEECGLDFTIPYYTPTTGELLHSPEALLTGAVIAVARDDAFSFIYPANIDLLESMGARIKYFSPLENETVPDCDALWLPGGYPELHLETLSSNHETLESIRSYVDSGKPGLAECGGMMVLGKSITSKERQKGVMAGAMNASFIFEAHFQSVGYQSLDNGGHRILGHSFHHSKMKSDQKAIVHWTKKNGGKGEGVYQVGGLLASYSHAYFRSNPQWIASVFAAS